MKSFKFMGWVRDGKGKVIKRPLKDICNCVTVAPHSETTTPYVVEFNIDEVS